MYLKTENMVENNYSTSFVLLLKKIGTLFRISDFYEQYYNGLFLAIKEGIKENTIKKERKIF